MKKVAVSLFSLLVVAGCDSPASDVTQGSTIDWSNANQNTDAIFSKFNTNKTPGCAVGVIYQGKYILEKGYGMANLEHGIPISRTSIFRTGSLAKQFTDAAIAVLVEEGKVDLDADIHTYLPDLAKYEHKVTVRQMIHHISGIPDYEGGEAQFTKGDGNPFRFGNEDYYTIQEFYDHAKGLTLRTSPLTEFHYSNTAYFFLSQMIEKVTGESLGTYAAREVFKPLGMDKSFFNENVNAIVPERVDGYQSLGKGNFEINMTNLSWVGDGGVYTSLEDFIKWDQNFYDNKMGNGGPDLINMMETPHSFDEGQESRYAWGMNVSTDRGQKMINHTGSWVGFRAAYGRYPDLGLSFVAMCNVNNASPFGKLIEAKDHYLDALGVPKAKAE